MNRVFYAMIAIAFAVAAFMEFADPPVPFSEAERAELVEAVEDGGPGAVISWLEAEDEARNTEYAEALANASNPVARALVQLSKGPSDLVADIAYSGGLAAGSLEAELAAAAGPEPTGESVVAALERVGDFSFGEAGTMKGFNDGLFKMVKAAVVDVVIPLIGAMAFFLGLMKVVEEAGAMKIIAKLLRPVLRILFPGVPPDHPAMSAMILNMAANALGLGNAATPFGIKAMQELDKLNRVKGTATNAMCLFLAINTSALSLLPTGVIAIREALGSKAAAGIMGTTLFATAMSTTAAIIVAKLFERASPDPVPEAGAAAPVAEPEHEAEASEAESKAEAEMAELQDGGEYPLWVTVSLFLTLFFVVIPVLIVFGKFIGPWLVPMLVVGFMTYGALNGVSVYEAFVSGATEGWHVGVRIVPYVVAILGAIGMLRGSGAIDLFVGLVGPYTSLAGMPAEALPMALLRPLSGSGSLGVMMGIIQEHGADSYIGYLVSTMYGSTETTFYTLAVYFGAVQIQRIRHAMAAALTADLVGMVAAVAAVAAYFRFAGL